MHSSALSGSGCQRDCVWGQLGEQSFSGKGAVGRHSQISHPLTLGNFSQSRLCLSWSHTYLSRSVPVPVHGLLILTWWTKQLRPDWFPRTCLVTTDLSGHHQAVFEAVHISRPAPLTPTPVVWDGHWLERPCPASLGLEHKFQLPVPQGTTSPHCALTWTAEYDPLCVSWQQGKTAASWTVSTSSTLIREGIVLLTPWHLTAQKNCKVWNPRVHN